MNFLLALGKLNAISNNDINEDATLLIKLEELGIVNFDKTIELISKDKFKEEEMTITRKEAEQILSDIKIPKNIDGNYFIIDILEALGLLKFKVEETNININKDWLKSNIKAQMMKLGYSPNSTGINTAMTAIDLMFQNKVIKAGLLKDVEPDPKLAVGYYYENVKILNWEKEYGQVNIYDTPEGLEVWIGGMFRYKQPKPK